MTSGPLGTRDPHGEDPLRSPRFPCASGADPLRLATRVNSPASDSRLTVRRRYPRSYYRVAPGSFPGIALSRRTSYPRPVSGSFHRGITPAFQLSLTVLVRYRTRDVFSLGGRLPPTSRANTNARYSGTPGLPHPSYAYGAITLYGPGLPPEFGFPGEGVPGPIHPTSPESFPSGFSLGCAAFGRPYSRHRVCFLFLRVLRCFNSPGSRGFSPQFGDPRFYGCMRLVGAYRRLPRPSSAPEPSHPPAGFACIPGPSGLPCAASFERPPFPQDVSILRCIRRIAKGIGGEGLKRLRWRNRTPYGKGFLRNL